MINVQKMVPEVYYNRSRDFQLFGRLYELIFNYIKNNTMAIKDMNENLNPNQNILELVCNTLGFVTTHSYSNDQLSALCSIFLRCIKSKGTINAIKLLIEMVCNVENSKFKPNVNYDFDKDYVYIIIPSDVTDLTLVRDVLTYIMPAGCRYVLISRNQKTEELKSEIILEDNISKEVSWSISSSAIINTKGKNPQTDITNYNITESGDILPNDNLESVNSSIISLGINDVDTEKESKEISKKLVDAFDIK